MYVSVYLYTKKSTKNMKKIFKYIVDIYWIFKTRQKKYIPFSNFQKKIYSVSKLEESNIFKKKIAIIYFKNIKYPGPESDKFV